MAREIIQTEEPSQNKPNKKRNIKIEESMKRDAINQKNQ